MSTINGIEHAEPWRIEDGDGDEWVTDADGDMVPDGLDLAVLSHNSLPALRETLEQARTLVKLATLSDCDEVREGARALLAKIVAALGPNQENTDAKQS